MVWLSGAVLTLWGPESFWTENKPESMFQLSFYQANLYALIFVFQKKLEFGVA